MKEKDERKICLDCKYYDKRRFVNLCTHPDNKGEGFDPIEGVYQIYIDLDVCKKWNKEGFCLRFEKK